MARPKKEVAAEEVVIKKRKPRVSKVKIEEVKEDINLDSLNENKYTCKFCGHKIDNGLTICPNCRRKNKNSVNYVVFLVLGIVFLFAVIFYHFVDSYIVNSKSGDSYIKDCVFVSYLDMVRIPKNYLHKDVAIVGKVVSVDGYDDGLYNVMTITLDMNLFDDGTENLVTVLFNDRNYEMGFINGDIIKVYGEYDTINGNVPYVEAKYIVFNN